MGHQVEVIAGPPYPEVTDGVTLHRLKSLSTYHPQSSLRANLPKVRKPIDLYELSATRVGIFADPLGFSLRAYSKLKELTGQQRFDIIHDNQCLGYGLLLMKRLKTPIVATIHHPLPLDRQADLDQANRLIEKWRVKKFYSFIRMQSFVARRLERVITVSQSAAAEIGRFFKVAPDKLRVVYNGIDANIYKRGASKSKDGLIMGNTLEGLVNFTGRVTRDELVEYYSRAEIAMVPSLYEGFGLPAAAAMADTAGRHISEIAPLLLAWILIGRA
jgi:glycosyltransferase involved in cell wall biosynthesis